MYGSPKAYSYYKSCCGIEWVVFFYPLFKYMPRATSYIVVGGLPHLDNCTKPRYWTIPSEESKPWNGIVDAQQPCGVSTSLKLQFTSISQSGEYLEDYFSSLTSTYNAMSMHWHWNSNLQRVCSQNGWDLPLNLNGMAALVSGYLGILCLDILGHSALHFTVRELFCVTYLLNIFIAVPGAILGSQ